MTLACGCPQPPAEEEGSAEGDTVELIVGGVELSGSADRTSVTCTDSGSTGIHATWVAADNSL